MAQTIKKIILVYEENNLIIPYEAYIVRNTSRYIKLLIPRILEDLNKRKLTLKTDKTSENIEILRNITNKIMEDSIEKLFGQYITLFSKDKLELDGLEFKSHMEVW